MQTIHIDKYDAENRAQPAAEQSAGSSWTERFSRGGAGLQREVGAAVSKVARFVKANPGATALAALGVGLFAAPGKHRLLKAAYGAFALPYLKRQIVGATPST
jgi:hypothetical protein